MSLTVQKASPGALAWLSIKAGCSLTPDARGIEAVDEDGHVRGVVGFDQMTENAVQAHMAVTHSIVWRRLLWPSLQYVFEQAGKGVLLGIIPSHRWRACRFVQRAGFHELTRIPDGWAKGDDMIVYRMRREDWRRRADLV